MSRAAENRCFVPETTRDAEKFRMRCLKQKYNKNRPIGAVMNGDHRALSVKELRSKDNNSRIARENVAARFLPLRATFSPARWVILTL